MKKRTKILSIILALVLLVGTVTFASFAESFIGNNALDTKNDLEMLDYFGSDKNVVFIGDSITQGLGSSGFIRYTTTDSDGNTIHVYGNSEEYGELNGLTNYKAGAHLYDVGSNRQYEAIDGNGWAQMLKNYLQDRYGCTVKNYGISGATTGHLYGQKMNSSNTGLDISDLPTDAQGNVRAFQAFTKGFDTVVIMLGTNDRTYDDVSVFSFNLNAMVNYLKNVENKQVILMSSVPVVTEDKNLTMEQIDGAIQDIAEEQGVPFISLYTGMNNYLEETDTELTDLMTVGGLHLNDEGYKVMFSLICEALDINDGEVFVDATRNVDIEVACDKTGYEFTAYKVADIKTTTNPYEVRYDSLIESIEDEIFNGDSEGLLAELDKVPAAELTEIVGTYSTDEDGTSKLLEDLPAGIYYVRATDFPANVYAVQNSVFALPYYVAEQGWIYESDTIPLATKVDESEPEIVKTITNSTKDNVNFTDVSLGDVVEFEIEASRVGSANEVASKDFRLNSYVVSDIMESGLTLNQDSFVVTLEDIDGNTIATLDDTTDYVVNIVANEGVDTTFTISLTPEYLQETEFYTSANVVIAYSAVLNEYSTREFDGNYNTATNLTYSNKTNVSATVGGNTVYAYTFGIEVNKYDDAGTPLAGSEFGLYLTEADAKAMENAIATGTSTDDGKVEFFTADGDVIRLASGDYFIVESKATESYNRYTDVIPVTITVEYGETEVNGTYIESAPENGIQLVEVKNSKVLIPNTGGNGAMYRYLIAAAFLMLAITFVVLKKRNSKKATATK